MRRFWKWRAEILVGACVVGALFSLETVEQVWAAVVVLGATNLLGLSCVKAGRPKDRSLGRIIPGHWTQRGDRLECGGLGRTRRELR
jgi:hypothetical protein